MSNRIKVLMTNGGVWDKAGQGRGQNIRQVGSESQNNATLSSAAWLLLGPLGGGGF